jgi:hypothetical protein
MDPLTFCLYSLAAACLVWGVMGLRFALSVLAANAVLAVLFFCLTAAIDNTNLQYALVLSYPLYLGLAFVLFAFCERVGLPSLNIFWRFGLGCAAALCLALWANGDALLRGATQLGITYFVQPQERAGRLADFLRRSDKKQRCDESYATLMTLAVDARDAEVVRVLFDAFSVCDGAAETVNDTVRPVLDSGDAAALDFFLQCGLFPDTEVFGHDYANGTALAYAATVAKRPELVRQIVASAPERARRMKYLGTMLETLKEQGGKEILSVLEQMGVK